jgi:hypothetical protein
MEDKVKIAVFVAEELDTWFKDGYDVFIKHGYRLLEFGLELEKVKEILSDLYYAVSNEYE